MNESILIVEDEEELCMTLGDRLRSEGYVVDFAADGQAGFEKATQLPFDLIILDIMLPLRSGLEICTDIRRAGLATPILLLTARSQTVDKVIGLKLGADDYVTKPFETMELVARIEALLRRSPTKADIARLEKKISSLGAPAKKAPAKKAPAKKAAAKKAPAKKAVAPVAQVPSGPAPAVHAWQALHAL